MLTSIMKSFLKILSFLQSTKVCSWKDYVFLSLLSPSFHTKSLAYGGCWINIWWMNQWIIEWMSQRRKSRLELCDPWMDKRKWMWSGDQPPGKERTSLKEMSSNTEREKVMVQMMRWWKSAERRKWYPEEPCSSDLLVYLQSSSSIDKMKKPNK